MKLYKIRIPTIKKLAIKVFKNEDLTKYSEAISFFFAFSDRLGVIKLESEEIIGLTLLTIITPNENAAIVSLTEFLV